MAQDGNTAGGNSYTIDNVTFPVGRTKLNSIFNAVRTTNMGSSAPDLVAGQFWIDNTTPSATVWTMYFFDGTDSISFATIDTTNNTVNFIDSTFTQLTSDLATNGNNINFGDNDKALFGADNDLQIYHDGSHSYIKDNGTGNLTLSGTNLYLTTTNGQIYLGAITDGAVSLYYDNSEKLATTTSGVTVTGTLNADGIALGDNEYINVGTSADLKIYHDGSHSYIEDTGTGQLRLRGNDRVLIAQYNNNEAMGIFNVNGSVELRYDNATKFETTSSGIDVTGTITATSTITSTSGTSSFSDVNITSELNLTNTGANYIDFAGTAGVLRWLNSSPSFENILVARRDAEIELYYNGSQKLETTSTGVTVTGVVESDAPTRHSIRPSLNLDFANSKTLDPRITFTRGSSGVYYDGYSSVKAEENLFPYSEDFTQAGWGKNGITVTADDTTAPDGTTTAERLTAGAGGAYIYRGGIMQTGKEYTISIYAKAGTGDNLRITNISSAGTGAWFDLSTGTIGTQNGASNTATITNVGNGWYRCTRTFASVTSSPTTESLFGVNDADGSTGSVDGEYIYVWGAQLEERDSATAYTPTTSSPITKYQPQLQTAGSNIARFDHNPITGESLGLLIEEQRTNIITNSETTDSTQNGSRTLNEMIAPDGTLTADRFNDDTVNGRHRVFLDVNFSATAGTVYTYSVYVKIGLLDTVDYIGIVEGSGALWVNAIFDPSNNWSYTLYNADSASAVDVGNGWYRISMTYTRSDTGNGKFGVAFYTTSSSTDLTNYTGTGYNHFYTWGGQIEVGSFPTSYIKTTGSQVTRSADDAVMTGSNFTDWFNNQEGTLYINCNINFLSETNIGAVSLGDSSNRIEIRGTGSSTNNPRFDSVYNGTAQMAIQIPSLGSEKNRRLSLSYNMNDYNISTSANGNSVNKDVSGNIPIINSDDGLKIGKNAYTSSSQQLGGTIKKVSYYPIALTDNEIQDLTEA